MENPLRLRALSLCAAIAVSCVFGSSRAQAFEWSLRLDGDLGVQLAAPQTRNYSLGGGGWLEGSVGGRFVDGHLSVGLLGFPSQAQGTGAGGLLAAGGGVRFRLPHDAFRISPWLAADALYVRTGALDRFGFSAAVGVSFRLTENRVWWLSPLVRYVQIVQPSTSGFDDGDAKMLLAGLELEWQPGARRPTDDRDGDGIRDADDRCPDAPGPAATHGCPDKDNDGIADSDDKCPADPGPAATHGCPDQDKDGIADRDDKCPADPGPAATNGCPDQDKDGIADRDDACPAAPGPVATRGCPDTDGDGVLDATDRCPTVKGDAALNGCPDSDGDGVPDIDDLCPDKKGEAANRGCPARKLAAVKAKTIEIREMVYFDTEKSEILPKSFQVLDDVVAVLVDARAVRIRIEGHTDNVGNRALNQTLSESRAKAVREYLILKGVAAERLESVGFGQDRPIAINDTPEGREKNRRVDFVILQQGETP